MFGVLLGQSSPTTRLTRSKSKYTFHQRLTKSISVTNHNELTAAKSPRSCRLKTRALELMKMSKMFHSLTNVIPIRRHSPTISVIKSSTSRVMQTASRPTQGMKVPTTAKSKPPWFRSNFYRLSSKRKTLIIMRRLRSCFNKSLLIRTSTKGTFRKTIQKSRKPHSHSLSLLRISRKRMNITKCRSCS